ncbi:MAG: hypothetical protein AAFX93_03065 [Verrucomicrobiota bacterium]
MEKQGKSIYRVAGILTLFATLTVLSVQAMPILPMAFFFDDPEDDREDAIEAAGDWSDSEVSTISRPGFSLKYPSNWKVASHQADYDPDRLFTIETPGQSHIVIEVFDVHGSVNLEQTMSGVLEALDGPAIDTYSYGDFESWGSFQGEGKHLKGKIMRIIPGGCRIFATTIPGKGKGLLVTEFYMSDDLPDALPGFDLISRTFVFN